MSGERHCLQCGAILKLHAAPLNPNNSASQSVAVCSACGSRAYDVPGNRIKELTDQRDELLAALKISLAYLDAPDPVCVKEYTRDVITGAISRIEAAR
jgi:hypothetical protein